MKGPWLTMIFAVLVLLAMAGLQGWLVDEQAKLAAARARADAAGQVHQQAVASAPQVAQARAVKNRIAAQADMPGALFDFLKQAEEAGQVHIGKALFQDSGQAGSYVRLPVQLQGEADSLTAFQHFVGRLEQFPYTSRVGSVRSSVTPNATRVAFTVIFYVYQKPQA